MLAVLSPAVLWVSATAVGADTTRPVIEKQDDLPRHTYTVTGQATALYTSETRDQLLTLAKAIQADIENDLATYDIRDDNTIQGFYAVLGTVALLEEDWQGYLDWLAKRRALETHGAGGAPDERKALAREIFEISDKALRKAISESTEILWVTSAGNSDNDIQFDEFYPSSYDYPNLLTVGAVDLAGDETSFTSLGKVDVYGNGFEVDSYVPGGNRIPFNGTSMSSPQVVNLAGKLLALYPDLSVAQLKAAIIEGADEKALETRSIRLMNPRSSLELAASLN